MQVAPGAQSLCPIPDPGPRWWLVLQCAGRSGPSQTHLWAQCHRAPRATSQGSLTRHSPVPVPVLPPVKQVSLEDSRTRFQKKGGTWIELSRPKGCSTSALQIPHTALWELGAPSPSSSLDEATGYRTHSRVQTTSAHTEEQGLQWWDSATSLLPHAGPRPASQGHAEGQATQEQDLQLRQRPACPV